MASVTTNWILQLVDRVTGPLKNVAGQATKASGSFDGLVNKAALAALKFNQISQAVGAFNDTLDQITAPGKAYQSSLAEVEAITGVTGAALNDLGDAARANAKKFGGDAAKSLDVYKLLLSQLGPELAKTPKILSSMADSVSLLSKTMGGDTTGAVEVLTTAMNQYGISIDDPIAAQAKLNQFMNAMSAGAKEGSAELPQLKAAIQNVGGDAKSSGLKFEVMVSAVEALDKAGKKGAEGGVALRNALSSLNQGRFLPKDVQKELLNAGIDLQLLSDKTIPFTDRLRALKPIQQDAALISKLFGKENKLAAEALINSVDAQDRMTKKITGTNTSVEQATIIMGTNNEMMSRWTATFKDWGITAFNATESFLPFLSAGSDGLQMAANFGPAIELMTGSYSKLTKWLGKSAKAQAFMNLITSLNPFSATVLGILALIAVVAVVIAKYDEWGAALSIVLGPLGLIIGVIQSFRRNWESIKEAFASGGIIAGLKRIGIVIFDAVLLPMQQLLEIVAKFTGSDLAASGAAKIKDFRKSLDLNVGVAATDTKQTAIATADSPTVNSVIAKSLNGGGKQNTETPSKAIQPIAQSNGNGKQVSIKMDFKNTFNVSSKVKESVDDIGNMIMKKINTELTDGLNVSAL